MCNSTRKHSRILNHKIMPDQTLQILQLVTNKPGYLFKIQQILDSGILETKGDKCEIHFDMDGKIRKIYGPRLRIDK